MEQSASASQGGFFTLPSSRPPTLNRCRSGIQRPRIGMRFPSSLSLEESTFTHWHALPVIRQSIFDSIFDTGQGNLFKRGNGKRDQLFRNEKAIFTEIDRRV